MTARPARGALAVAAGVTAIGLALLVGARAIPSEAAYAGVGPRAFPLLVGTALTALGGALAVALFRGMRLEPETGEDVDAGAAANWRAMAWLLAGLVLAVLTIERLGFPVAAALVFALGARGFGSRAWPRNLGLGLALAVVTWWLFARGLGVSLPGGLLERIG